MKKILLGIALAANALCGQAQYQLANADFNGTWEDCIPWDSENNTKKSGTQPQGWTMSHVYSPAGAMTVGEKKTDGSNTYVYLKNVGAPIGNQKIPAYISLGTTWATAQAKGFGSVKEGSADGGTWGGITFDKHPDAVSFDYMRDNSSGTSEKATIVAYMWTGEWQQQNVPGNTTYPQFLWSDYVAATTCTMINRDRNILGLTTSTGGTITKSSDAKLIASVEKHLDATSTWSTYVAEFDYGNNAGVENVKVEKLNVIFSATDYFGDRSGIVKGNSLSIDNVKLLYYHALTDLKLNGTSIAGFSENKTAYEVYTDYDPSMNITYTKKGQGATVLAPTYDESTKTLSIRVNGEDISEDANSYTVYTVKFLGPKKSAYTNTLAIDLSGITLDPENKTIYLLEYEYPKSYGFLLENFAFMGSSLGDIKVDNLTQTANGTTNIYKGDQDLSLSLEGMPLDVHVYVDANVDASGNMLATIFIPEAPAVGDIYVYFAPALAITNGTAVSTTAGTYNVTLNRSFKQGWNTICLPFDMAATSFMNMDEFPTTTLQTFDNANNGTLNFKDVTTTGIEANKPYLIFFDTAFNGPVILGGVSVKAASPIAITNGEYSFIGNYTGVMDMNGKYGVATGTDDKQRIMLGGAGSTLKSTGAYFTSTSAKANGMRICLEGEDGVTSIDGVTVVNGNAPIYNLQGVKVGEGTTEGLAKGIYIVNGKKFIVK